MSVRIYVEGGGDSNPLRTECRRGFAEFFKKVLPAGKQPKVVTCGSRNDAIEDFCTALRHTRGDQIFLLVDAEGSVPENQTVRNILLASGKWAPSSQVMEEQTHLMVQCMESWFLADVPTLKTYFGQGFQESALPKNSRIETVSKQDVLTALKKATRQSKTKGDYSKGEHSFAILALIDPTKVRQASPHAERLIQTLLQRVGG
ncbi:DUF4276 family protein [Cystobacter fuscus]